MPWGNRINVEKGDEVIVLVGFFCGDFAGGDFAKYAVVHTRYATIFYMHGLHPLIERFFEEHLSDSGSAFLEPDYTHRPDPFLMAGMEDAVSRITVALSRSESIAVWSDYDCDGVPGGALMRDFFSHISYPLTSYIAERSEGYGLNKDGIRRLAESGVTLIVTVDCGITAVDEVAYARSLGVDVIITDHHLPRVVDSREVLPEAVSVLNPHREGCTYPFKELCGTGVAFKLVEALGRRLREAPLRTVSAPKEGSEKWLLDLVALATIADMVSLTGENRTLAWYGLVVLRKGRRLGLASLLSRMRIPIREVTEDDISFSIAPKINAASRMKSPHLALDLLTTTDEVRAKELARELVRLNDARKLEGARVAKEVKHRLEGRVLSDVVILGNSAWKPALLGIAATNVVETYQRTVCLWGEDGDLIKGSCRSDGSVNIVSLLAGASEVLEEFGGHELSGGFSVKREALHTLPSIFEATYARVKTGASAPTTIPSVSVIPVSVSELSTALYRSLRRLAPFGIDNPKPLFSLRGARIERVLTFGAHGEHVRLTLADDSGASIDAVAFFFSRSPFRDTVELLSSGDVATVVGTFEQSFFGSKRELRIRLEDISLAA